MISSANAVQFIKSNPKVAIVGLSPKTDRPSFHVGSFLSSHGFKITPINPNADEILGFASKSSLADLSPGDVDWIDIFLNPARLMGILPDILRLRPKLVWCQIGVVNEEFRQRLEQEGIQFIEDKCPAIEWSAQG